MNDTANWGSVSALPGMSADEIQLASSGNGKLIILFKNVQKKMEMESKLQGRPVFKEVTHIVKIVPGDQRLQIDRPMRETDMEEFPVEWARWCQTKENKIPGFPIENWPALSDTQKAELKAMKIHTVEQMANLSDAILQNFRGGGDLRAKAKIFLEAGKDAELIGAIRKEAAAKEAAMQAQIDELRALIEAQTAPNPKKEKVVA